MITISNKKRVFIIGVLILAAYSMLTYSITKNILPGVITDIDEKFHKSTYRFLLGNIFNLFYINFSETSLASD